MAHLLVWGKTRELIAGEIPAGITTEEVDSLAALQSAVEAKGSALVLADPARLDAERMLLESWTRSGGNRRALLICVAETSEADELIRRFPFLDDVLTKPLTAARLRLRIDRALDTINSRRVIEQLDDALMRKSQELHELNNIGVALSAQRDRPSRSAAPSTRSRATGPSLCWWCRCATTRTTSSASSSSSTRSATPRSCCSRCRWWKRR